jgi:peptidoglycan/LPS O-acetylase OafA/YrhL
VVPVSTQLATGREVRTRVHYLDWLRVLAVLGVFLYHAGHPFDTTGWHVKNEDQSAALTVVMDFLGLWGLPLFFLIAGAGSVLALRWRTAAQYLRERVQRLLVPLVVGYLLLSPVQSFIEETHFGRYSGSFLPFVPAFFGRVRDDLLEAGLSPGPLVVGWPYHLWFLAFLLWFSLLGLPLLSWLRGTGGRRLSGWLGRLAERRGAVLLLALPMALLHVAVRGLPGRTTAGASSTTTSTSSSPAPCCCRMAAWCVPCAGTWCRPCGWGSPGSSCCSPEARSGSLRPGTGAATRGRTRGWSRCSPCRPGGGW